MSYAVIKVQEFNAKTRRKTKRNLYRIVNPGDKVWDALQEFKQHPVSTDTAPPVNCLILICWYDSETKKQCGRAHTSGWFDFTHRYKSVMKAAYIDSFELFVPAKKPKKPENSTKGKKLTDKG